MSVRRRAVRARMERDERRARENENFRQFHAAVMALIQRKKDAGENTITPQEFHDATCLPGTAPDKP